MTNPIKPARVTPPWLTEGLEELKRLATEELDRLFLEDFAHLAARYRRMAQILLIKEERGESLDSIRAHPLLPLIRRIAQGQLLPEMLAAFGSRFSVLRRAQYLSTADQQRLVSGERFPIAFLTDSGVAQVPKAAIELKAREAAQLIATDPPHICTEEEQIAMLRARQSRRLRTVVSGHKDVSINPDGSVAFVKPCVLKLRELRHLLDAAEQAARG